MRRAVLFHFALCLLVLALPACGKPVEAPMPRHIALEGQPNFRDLGGYETADGRHVRWGQVFRSGELPGLTEADVDRLADLGLRTNVNFLTPEEIETHGNDRLPEDVEEIRLPIKGTVGDLAQVAHEAIRSGDFSRLSPDLTPKAHAALLTDGREQYAALLRTALDPTKRPLVFHCSHGVHRTGTAAALLLGALGVPWGTIREDYLLSNIYRGAETEAALERIRAGRAKAEGIAPTEVDMTNVEAFYVLDGHYIDGSLDEAVAKWGSMDAYLRVGLGLTDDEIQRLRDELLE